jgi:hypothetical protein
MKYEIKLLVVMLMVIATAAVLTTAATSDETNDNSLIGSMPNRGSAGIRVAHL